MSHILLAKWDGLGSCHKNIITWLNPSCWMTNWMRKTYCLFVLRNIVHLSILNWLWVIENPELEISFIWSISSSSSSSSWGPMFWSLYIYFLISLIIVKHVSFSLFHCKQKIKNSTFSLCSRKSKSKLKRWCLWSSLIYSWNKV